MLTAVTGGWVLVAKERFTADLRRQEISSRLEAARRQLRYAATQGDEAQMHSIEQANPTLAASYIREMMVLCRASQLSQAASNGDNAAVMAGITKVRESEVSGLSEPIDVLYGVAWKGHTETLRTLLNAGWGPDGIRRDGAPLSAAASLGHFETAKLLLNRGARPDPPTPTVASPLCYAAAHGRADLAKILLGSGADSNRLSEVPRWQKAEYVNAPRGPIRIRPSYTPDLRSTPLALAVSYNQAAAVRILLERGADPLKPCSDGKTAVDIARDRGLTELVSLMAKHPVRSSSSAEPRAPQDR